MTETIVPDELVIRDVLNPARLIETLSFKTLNEPGRQGVEYFPLYETAQTGPDGPTAMIVRYMPGASNKRHRHVGYELILVLDGELQLDENTYGPGELIVGSPGSDHAAASSKGCLILIIWEKPVQRITDEESRRFAR